MKFTTPATASAPYTAEAPPVMTSTLSIIADGMVLMSTTSAALAGWVRRPSTSTRLRLVPRPRRLAVEMPPCGWRWAARRRSCLAIMFWSGVNCGSWFRVARSELEVFLNVSAATVTIGLVAVKSRRAMREPVTTTSLTVASSAGLAAF